MSKDDLISSYLQQNNVSFCANYLVSPHTLILFPRPSRVELSSTQNEEWFSFDDRAPGLTDALPLIQSVLLGISILESEMFD